MLVILQPENYDRQQKITRNSKSVLASSDKPQAFDPKQMSQIIAELSREIAQENETIGEMSRRQADFHVALLRKIVRDEFRGLA